MMAQELFMEGLKHFEPLLRSGLQTQKKLHFTDRNYQHFVRTGNIASPVSVEHGNKLMTYAALTKRIEILQLIDLVLQKEYASCEEKQTLSCYIEQALIFSSFSKSSGFSLHQTNMVLNKANKDAITKMRAAEVVQ